MQENKPKKTELNELRDLYLFQELFEFVRKSAGITVAISYLVLLLSSMSYLYIVYSALDINILQFVTFEDILATPIKNPNIILSYCSLFLIFYVADVGNRYRARNEEKYTEGEIPLLVRIIQIIVWAPKKRKANIRSMLFIIAFSLVAYVLAFATHEGKKIKSGEGEMVEIVFADEPKVLKTTLLGTTTNYVLTYDHESGESFAYYVEAIKSIKKLKPLPDSPEKGVSVKAAKIDSEEAVTKKPQ